jgi:hypothetical protein
MSHYFPHPPSQLAKEGNAKRLVVAYDEIVFDFAVPLDSVEDRTDEPAA